MHEQISYIEGLRHNILSDIELDVDGRAHAHETCKCWLPEQRHKPILGQNEAPSIQDVFQKHPVHPSKHVYSAQEGISGMGNIINI